MAMTSCRECGEEISTTARACPKCGARVPRTKWWLWVPLAAVAGFLAFGFVRGNSPEGQQRANQRAAIDLCWQEQQRKSMDPGAARLIAGTCERMERDFRDRWGVAP